LTLLANFNILFNAGKKQDLFGYIVMKKVWKKFWKVVDNDT